MKGSISIIGGILLAASMSSPVFAGHKHGGGGGESQAGGLPGLEDRVELDEGENNWAVVTAAGTVVRSQPSSGVTVEHTASSGIYHVVFTKDVSGCAYVATIGDTGTSAPTQGQISVAGGDTTDEVLVQTFNAAGVVATDSPFHLYVSCPGHTGD